VPELKNQPGRELQVHGSSRLAQSLLDLGLVDEYLLLVYPVVLGHGKRLFAGGSVPTAMHLVDTRTTSAGVVVRTYVPAGKPHYGSFGVEYS
jgi:dihydrofolate reductase